MMIAGSTFVPTTFEERGTAVPFTTPVLAQSRVRKDYRKRLEVVIPSLGQGRGNYVVPVKALPEMFPLTLHDQEFCGEISGSTDINPYQIRTASLRLAQAGMAGPDGIEHAAKVLETEEQTKSFVNFSLMMKIVSPDNADDIARLARAAEDPEQRRAARQELIRIAREFGQSIDALDAFLSALSEALVPLGIAGVAPGRLRELFGRLDSLRDGLLAWAGSGRTQNSAVARFCADVTDVTIVASKGVIEAVDAQVEQVRRLFAAGQEALDEVGERCNKIAWLLDGWAFVFAWWNETQGQPDDRVDEALLRIFEMIPMVPKEECPADSGTLASTAQTLSQRRWVRTAEDWRSGTLDFDLVARLEVANLT